LTGDNIVEQMAELFSLSFREILERYMDDRIDGGVFESLLLFGIDVFMDKVGADTVIFRLTDRSNGAVSGRLAIGGVMTRADSVMDDLESCVPEAGGGRDYDLN